MLVNSGYIALVVPDDGFCDVGEVGVDVDVDVDAGKGGLEMAAASESRLCETMDIARISA